MKKFCTKCGRKLENNEKCTCEKIKKEEKVYETSTNFLSKLEQFLKQPVESLKDKNFLENNEYLMILLASLSYGILGLSLPFRSIICNFIPITIVSFIFFLLLPFIFTFCENKQARNYQEYLSVVATSSIILLLGNVLSFVLAFISITLPVIIIFASFLLFLLFCYQGFCERGNDINSVAYKFLISFLLTSGLLVFIITL